MNTKNTDSEVIICGRIDGAQKLSGSVAEEKTMAGSLAYVSDNLGEEIAAQRSLIAQIQAALEQIKEVVLK